MDDAANPLLSIQSLTIEAVIDRERRVLVDNISLDLAPGEAIGLIGESGAGKSTIGLAALGYTRPGCRIISGRVLFKNADILTMPPRRVQALRGRHIAYIAQSAAAAFNPALTINDQVSEVPVTTAMTEARHAPNHAAKLYDELDLPDPQTFGNQYPHQVSGGQLQRAMAAMAISARPEMLVFDEPTTALDVTTQVEVLAVFRRLIRKHRTAALYIAHDLAVVAQIVDRIMVLRNGRMIEFGKTREVLEQPRHEYTKRLISEKITSYVGRTTGSGVVPLLTLNSVSASYRALPNVIREIDLEVRRGDTLAIVGESGSGKSTLARVIVGMLPRAAGTMRFAGCELSPSYRRRTKQQLRAIQLIFQSPDIALNPHHTVFETIGRPLKFYFDLSNDRIKDKVADSLGQMGLPDDCMYRTTSLLSGGQKQRLCIARALSARPDLIICDEVTSALDPLVAEEILTLLDRVRQTHNIGLIFISHDIGTVRRFASEVVVMRNGAVVDRGPTARIFAPPYHEYTKQLISSVPQMRAGWLDEALAARGRIIGRDDSFPADPITVSRPNTAPPERQEMTCRTPQS